MRPILWTIPWGLLLLACSSSDPAAPAPPVTTVGTGGNGAGGGAGGTGGTGGSFVVEAPQWVDCTSAFNPTTECATVDMPYRHGGSGERTVPFFVQRVLASGTSRGQLWLLQGGPGVGGQGLLDLAFSIRSAIPDLDIYIPDHRGVGQSAPLECMGLDTPILGGSELTIDEAAVQATGTSCITALEGQWGSLDGFSSAEAGADLGAFIQAMDVPDEETFLWAVSYGTRWATRYLQQYPDQADGVVLDSPQFEGSDLSDFGGQLDTTGQLLLDQCANDTFCSGQLGGDPTAFFAQLITKLEGGHCPTSEGLTAGDHRLLLTKAMTLQYGLRHVLPALAYRMDRCDAGDEAAILNLRGLFEQSEQGQLSFVSGALNVHVTLSELYPATPPSFAALNGIDQGRRFSYGDAAFYRALYDVWPRYEDPLAGTYPSPSAPVLVFQGSDDPITPLANGQALAAGIDGADLVVFDEGGHGTLSNSPAADGDCGLSILAAFTAAPSTSVDASCAAALTPQPFDDDGISFLFGTSSLWD